MPSLFVVLRVLVTECRCLEFYTEVLLTGIMFVVRESPTEVRLEED